MKRKIIPCLDIKDGRVVKGVNFIELKDMGDPVELAAYYDKQGADELVFLDINRSLDKHGLMIEMIQKIKETIRIPLTVGGGISTLEDVDILLQAGVDKVSVSSAAVKWPALVNEISNKYGPKKLTVAIDAAYDNEKDDYFVSTQGGQKQTELTLLDWAKEVEERGAGSLLITSISHDGVKNGFDLTLIKQIASEVAIPVIASGGAGEIEDFIALFQETEAAAGLAASIFHQGLVSIQELKQVMRLEGIEVDD